MTDESHEFPKMLTVKLKDGRIVPLMKDNEPVIVDNREQERAFDKKTATAHDGRPEQHSHANYRYGYDPFETV